MIRVERLRKTYGGVTACADLTLSIEPGTTTAVIGPNGAGKSTLVQLLSGVVRPDAGEVYLGQRRITGLAPAHRSALGVTRTFQTSRVFPGLTVLESVMVGAYHGVLYEDGHFGTVGTLRDAGASLLGLPAWRRRRDEARERALAEMGRFGDRLVPRQNHYAYSLSYANRRRVEIARALAARPRVLVLDEPTAGMNPTETEELARLLADVRAERPELTTVFVEHKMNVVRWLSQRVLVMDEGALIADDTPQEALSDPRVIEAYLGASAVRKSPTEMPPDDDRRADRGPARGGPDAAGA